ncbi:MAG: ABC transporter permease subunit [Candidatus Latescibacteria bacterium]|nr:ABC transporter permease subunit [Candidatus Latescibacterota bacterium]
MVWMIAKREFLDNLLSFRFAVAFVLVLILSAFSAYVLNEDYKRQLDDYYTRVQMQDKLLTDFAHLNRLQMVNHPIKPPAKLGALFRGIPEDALVESFDNNPAQIFFPPMDFLFIVSVIMSLLAILFAYDAVCGEKERGTLRLAISTSVPRGKLLLGKWLGGLLSLLLPFTVSFILGLLITVAGLGPGWSGNDWAAIGLIFLGSLLYVACFFALGMLMSSRTERSSISLVAGLLVWAVLTLIVPNLAPYLAAWGSPLPPASVVENKLNKIAQEMGQAKSETARRLYRETGSQAKALEKLLPLIPEIEAKFNSRKNELFNSFLRKRIRQIKLSIVISMISPYSSYIYWGTELSGTGMYAYEVYFMGRKKQFQHIFGSYVLSKWNTLKKENPQMTFETLIDVSDRPRFNFVEERVSGRLRVSYIYLSALLIFNVIFFMGAFMSFLRYDVR